jgi:hypothetical protein
MHAAQFKVYLMIECFVWLPAAYIFCYRFQPTVRFAKTDSGKRIVIAASNFLERRAPSTHASLAKLANQAQGAPAGRAAAEWALLNKVGDQHARHVPGARWTLPLFACPQVLAPIGFPTKMWIAHRVVKNWDAKAVAAQPDARW